jgi:FixJ family two-component response regulator
MAAHVVLLDDDKDLIDSLADVLGLASQAVCLGVRSLEELVANREQALGASLVIIDINLGGGRPSGLDAYHWLKEQGYTGRVAFLTGHARSHPLVDEARRLGGVPVLQKPIAINDLLRLVAP